MPPRFELFSRPFNPVQTAPVNRVFRRPEPDLTPPDEPPSIEWGEGSDFIMPPEIQFGGITWPEDREDFEEEAAGRTLTEVSRSTSSVQIENPNDPSQFVTVERINSITMRDSRAGETLTLVFNN